MSAPRVFISYSHDSPEHKDSILALSNRLRWEGVDCIVDQYEQSPEDGWPLWCEKQVEQANFVLVVCTETYLRRFRRDEVPRKGLGATWEGHIITQALFNAHGKNRKFIPVTFSEEAGSSIPLLLQSATAYRLYSDYEPLYGRLIGQPLIQKPVLGSVNPKTEQERLPPQPSLERKQDLEALGHTPPEPSVRDGYSREEPVGAAATRSVPATALEHKTTPGAINAPVSIPARQRRPPWPLHHLPALIGRLAKSKRLSGTLAMALLGASILSYLRPIFVEGEWRVINAHGQEYGAPVVRALVRRVPPDRSLGFRVLKGLSISPESSRGDVVIDEQLSAALFGSGEPLGAGIKFEGDSHDGWLHVLGVVKGNTRWPELYLYSGVDGKWFRYSNPSGGNDGNGGYEEPRNP